MNDNELEEAYKHSFNNKSEILKSDICGCFYCGRIFNPQKITIWLYGDVDMTAQCPYCFVDSVIGESSGYAITNKFLNDMYKKWFN